MALSSVNIDFNPIDLDTIKADTILGLNAAQAFLVYDSITAAFAGELVRDVRKQIDEVTKLKRRATDPLNAALKEIRSWFKPAEDALEGFDELISDKLEQYLLGKEQEREAQIKAATEAAQSGDAKALTVALNAAADAKVEKIESVSARRVWVATIIAPDLLTREYLMPDEAKINAVARAAPVDQIPIIPGVKFTLEARLTAKR